MKKYSLSTLILSTLFVLLTLVGVNSAGEGVLRIATQPGIMYNPVFVAKHKGWVEEALAPKGFTVKWTAYLAGPPITESIAAGEQDVGYLGDTPVLISKAAGLETRIIATAGVAAKAQAIIANKDSGVKTLADL
ncbi:MAG: ABC transporter substrate-binding protein, partial [Planctomycetota bacterium]|nr:ABC transporter substrate-binding protein [Planctomycetota bacterium]